MGSRLRALLLVGAGCALLPAAAQDDFVAKARELKGEGQTDRAIAVLEEGLTNDADNASAHYVLGWLFLQKEQWEKARAAFERVVELVPDSEEGQEAEAALRRLGPVSEQGPAEGHEAPPAGSAEYVQHLRAVLGWARRHPTLSVLAVIAGVILACVAWSWARATWLNRGWTPLHEAARDPSGADELRRLLGDGADPNAATRGGATPLHVAAETGRYREAEVLLLSGADVNATRRDGKTPIHLAERLDVARLLVAEGADPNAKGYRGGHGRTPLHQAAEEGDKWAAGFFLDRGANVNAQDDYSQTPLHVAASRRDKEIVALLAAKGASSLIIAPRPRHRPLLSARHASAVLLRHTRERLRHVKDKGGETAIGAAERAAKTRQGMLVCAQCGHRQREGAWEEEMDRRAKAMGSRGFVNLSARPQCLKCGYFELADPSRPAPREDAVDVSRYARRLVEIYNSHGDLYDNAEARRMVREIGKEINARHGMEGMRSVCYRVGGEAGGIAMRSLEAAWHGIGAWMG